ncbi:MAG TPA: VCBS repeat-containing protein [Gemmatimonadaceae bacterium]|nr:VCBS repeat-containing protein [Gemmatimonadaceae bacterium]
MKELRQQGGASDPSALFTRLPSAETGVTFENRLTETQEFNVFTFRNFYNGGGVAIGDLTGDGLPEIVLTSSQQGPRLYLNEGHFKFRDVTAEARLVSKSYWTTGVTLADVNGDGRLDIYVCHSGNVPGKPRANELFINQGKSASGSPVFTDMAAQYGVRDGGYSTQAAFFDYDGDGRLDLYVLNNSPKPVTSFGMRNTRNVRDSLGGDRLYHNLGDRFVDVSERGGIYGNAAAFGLGIGVSDLNGDGRPDIYVANDFFEQDYLYINQGNGRFVESIAAQMPYTSYYSMGLDIADLDNDGRPDVYTTDMLPESELRLKSTSSFDAWDVYQARVRNGFHYQFMRNMLQLNNGDGTFSDVGQMAGVARTDWSWTALIADLDLDGNKDLFVTNGVYRDVTSQDYIAFLGNADTRRMATMGNRVDFMQLIRATSSTKLTSYAFRNAGHLQFTNATAAWGLSTPAFSNGAAYGDLDADGAVDLVVNNVNDEAFVYRNNARTISRPNYLQVSLAGRGANRFAVGAKVTLVTGGGAERQFQELQPTRGFESSSDYILTFGLGAHPAIDSVIVVWPDGRVSSRSAVAANQRVTLSQADARVVPPAARPHSATLFARVTGTAAPQFRHRENAFVDFDRERLMPKMVSTEGPALAVADVNGDGLDDVFIGGAKDQAGKLFVQRRDGAFVSTNESVFASDAGSEDVGALFFDANGDRRPDLYVVSGGNEFADTSGALQDRLYLNDGNGRFHKATDALPRETSSGSRAVAADYDGDGDLDVFVGGRVVPGSYGLDPESQLLRNDGKGHFTDVTFAMAPDLVHVGMVTDAAWQDVDSDGRPDLVVVGEWMPITVFHNAGGGKLQRSRPAGLENTEGWWNRIVAGDFTGDGRVDFIVGNLGLNSRLRASVAEPTTMYVKDFAKTGFMVQVVACYNEGRNYPVAMRDDLIKSLPNLRDRYPTFKDYALQTIGDIFSPAELQNAIVRKAATFATSLVKNNGDGTFTVTPLPMEAQFAPVYGILAGDLDADSQPDLLLGGNFDAVKPEIGRLGGSYGLFLKGDGRGSYAPLRALDTGFFVPGQTRDIQRVRTALGNLILVARNDDTVLAFRLRPASL